MGLFNQAMLGKQGWRLLTRPEALCSRVLKGKYYPNGGFLSATRKKKSSETWRAILHGTDIVRRGVIKRIGPGHDVSIWDDNWIHGIPSLKPRVRLGEVNVELISDLFLPNSCSWNEQLIRDSFIRMDAQEILKVRPGIHLQEDI